MQFSVNSQSTCIIEYNHNFYLDQPNWEITRQDVSDYNPTPDDDPSLFYSISQTNPYPFMPFVSDHSTPIISSDGDKIIFSDLPVGEYAFEVEFFVGSFLRCGKIIVIISPTEFLEFEDCCPQNCNFLCNGDFDNFPISEHTSGPDRSVFDHTLTTPFTFANASGGSNSVSVTAIDGNKRVLNFRDSPDAPPGQDDQFESGIVLPLRKAILPNETVSVTVRATAITMGLNTAEEQAYIRLFGMEDDFTGMSAVQNFPFDNTSPFTFNAGGDKGYYITSGLETDNFGIPIPLAIYDTMAHPVSTDINGAITYLDGLTGLTDYGFSWTNNTTKTINAIMVIGDVFINQGPPLKEDDIVDTRSVSVYNALKGFVLIDSIYIGERDPLTFCVTGDSIEACIDAEESVDFEICYCGPSNPLAPVLDVDVYLDQIAPGMSFVLPGGDFDANGKATATYFDGGSDCETLTAIIKPGFDLVPGSVIPISVSFGTDSDCSQCDDNIQIRSQTPAEVTIDECSFLCECPEVNNIGTKGGSVNWSSLTEKQKGYPCLAVEGELVLDVDIVIADKIFLMQANSKITINDNSIGMARCTLSGCNLLWDGISLKQDNGLLRIYNSIIRDARQGISRKRNLVTITALNNLFENNYIGIFLDTYGVFPPPMPYPIILSGNIFTSTSLKNDLNLKTLGKLGKYGIHTNSAIETFGISSPDPLDKNIFSNLSTGVFSTNRLGTEFFNDSFAHINPVAYYENSGYGILNHGSRNVLIVGDNFDDFANNQFYNVQNNIYSQSTSRINKINSNISRNGVKIDNIALSYSPNYIRNSVLVNVNNIGIHFRNFGNQNLLSISGDSITLVNGTNTRGIIVEGIESSQSTQYSVNNNRIESFSSNFLNGIQVSNLSQAFVFDNKVNMNSPYNYNWSGIYATELDSSRIFSNRISNTYTNRPAERSRSNGIFVNKVKNSNIYCNWFNKTDIGAYISGENFYNSFETNIFDSTFQIGLFMNKTSALTPMNHDLVHYFSGNRWFEPYDKTAVHLGEDKQIEKSRFWTNSDDLPVFPENYQAINEIELWFRPNQPGTDKEINDCDIDPTVKPEWLEPFALDSVTYAQYDDEMRIQSQLRAYEFMYDHPGFSYGATLDNFFSNYQTTYVGEVLDLRKQMLDIIKMPDALKSTLDSLDGSFYSLLDSISYFQSTIDTSSTFGDINQYTDTISSILANLNNIRSQQLSLLDDFEDSAFDDLTDLLVLLAAPTSSNIVEESMYVTLGHEINFYRLPGWLETSGALSELLEISNFCPDSAGSAVYWARALVRNLIPDLVWDNDALCGYDTTSSPKPSKASLIKNLTTDELFVGEFSVFPNPSNGAVTIRTPESFNGIIQIFDASGKLNQIFNTNKNEINLILSPGLYYLKFVSQEGEYVSGQKLIILK